MKFLLALTMILSLAVAALESPKAEGPVTLKRKKAARIC